MRCLPSRFLYDLDPDYLKASVERKTQEAVQTGSYYTPKVSKQPDRKPLSSPTRQKAAKPSIVEGVKVASIGELKVGSIVSHSRFGQGEVTGLEGDPDMAIVSFNNVGEKKLILKFAKLTIIE